MVQFLAFSVFVETHWVYFAPARGSKPTRKLAQNAHHADPYSRHASITLAEMI